MPPICLAEPSGRYLSFAEREEIALLKIQDLGVREIGRRLGRPASTISRELRRNAATRGGKLEYRASVAQWKAERLARRPKAAKLVKNPVLHEYVQDRLAGQVAAADGTPVPGPDVAWVGRRQDRRWSTAWSPEQIAGRLPIDFPDDESTRISHEVIYQALYVQSRGVLRRDLSVCLRTLKDTDVVTSAQAVAHLIANALPTGSEILVVGGQVADSNGKSPGASCAPKQAAQDRAEPRFDREIDTV